MCQHGRDQLRLINQLKMIFFCHFICICFMLYVFLAPCIFCAFYFCVILHCQFRNDLLILGEDHLRGAGRVHAWVNLSEIQRARGPALHLQALLPQGSLHRWLFHDSRLYNQILRFSITFRIFDHVQHQFSTFLRGHQRYVQPHSLVWAHLLTPPIAMIKEHMWFDVTSLSYACP